MGFKLKDGVWETTQTAGTGAYALEGKVADPAALHAYGDVFSDGDTFRYRVWGDDGEEEGIGQYDATNDEVTRVRVYRSTNGNAAVDWPAGGTKNITCDVASGALENLTDPDATGLLAQTAGETFARRTIEGGANVTVTDGDGGGGNPSVAVSPQGAGSGLNADTVDGEHAAAFADAVHNHDGSYEPARPTGFTMLAESVPTGYERSDETAGRVVKLAESGDTLGGTGGTDDVFGGNWATVWHQLTISEIPSHTHTYYVPDPDEVSNIALTGAGDDNKPYSLEKTTGSAGGGGSHRHNMSTPRYRIMGRIEKQ